MKKLALIFALSIGCFSSLAMAEDDYDYIGEGVVCAISSSESLCYGKVIAVADDAATAKRVACRLVNNKCPSADACLAEGRNYNQAMLALGNSAEENPEACNSHKPVKRGGGGR